MCHYKKSSWYETRKTFVHCNPNINHIWKTNAPSSPEHISQAAFITVGFSLYTQTRTKIRTYIQILYLYLSEFMQIIIKLIMAKRTQKWNLWPHCFREDSFTLSLKLHFLAEHNLNIFQLEGDLNLVYFLVIRMNTKNNICSTWLNVSIVVCRAIL